MVEYLIDNIYVCIGNRVFRQLIGIPIGTDCAPLLGNLYPFYFEHKSMKNLMKGNLKCKRRDLLLILLMIYLLSITLTLRAM